MSWRDVCSQGGNSVLSNKKENGISEPIPNGSEMRYQNHNLDSDAEVEYVLFLPD